MPDLTFFKDILSIDSTSGREGELMAYLQDALSLPGGKLVAEKEFLFLTHGTPEIIFCTHLDTVPPYIPPVLCPEEGLVRGRGSCDAKGQILAMWEACKRLAAQGCTGFGLLLVTSEETGSWGAKAFAKTPFRAPYLVIGEPTENKMVSAAKGTKAFRLTFRGEAFHSGYPQFGRSAVDAFVRFYNALQSRDFGMDPVLGVTTWNIGKLSSDNPQNILSPSLTCCLYFRTTFISDEPVQRWMAAQEGADLSVEAVGGDTPERYLTLPGFESAPVAFGSDAPHLSNFSHKIICGPGSIRFAHRDDEQISIRDIETASELYVRMFKALKK